MAFDFYAVFNSTSHDYLASKFVDSAALGKNAPIIAKDVSWLWRTAFNVALQGCSEWQHVESDISELFELSYKVGLPLRSIWCWEN